jgi:hypothetical protein
VEELRFDGGGRSDRKYGGLSPTNLSGIIGAYRQMRTIGGEGQEFPDGGTLARLEKRSPAGPSPASVAIELARRDEALTSMVAG